MYEIAVVASRNRSILNILGEISVGLQLSSTFISHATFFLWLIRYKIRSKNTLIDVLFHNPLSNGKLKNT